jgi:endonuclease G, mitochondrial
MATMGGWKHFGPVGDAQQTRVTQALLPLAGYGDRDGYRPDFITGQPEIPLPGAGKWQQDLLEVNAEARVEGRPNHVLAYRHFSVVMSNSRALPLFSAVNIDGALSDRAVERTDIWRRDPRIPLNKQNLSEGYGNANQGFFARGHMTRREDPNWGDRVIAEQADADTFHITNVAPQRQSFNAGPWLSLESYVLDNCDRENLKISVFTGPILTDQDPTYYNRRIPLDFWKIVAFVHPKTRELTTIGYRRSQVSSLPTLAGSRFVFGDFQDTQVPIEGLAEATGLDLSALAERDVMEGADKRIEIRVQSVSDIFLSR